ncbi:MAG: type II toxin-antitoxin system PemK/MazF family toxin [Acetobacteraceae bacterium]|nr:type II toxin-antitoxin system PemK/MazF family toxin [Acetobacteraceae bacterium]
MPIQFPVAPGTLLLCDYSTGFREPEMVKRRPAVVISPRLPHRNGLCTVVPLSTTPPEQDVPYVCRLDLMVQLPEPFSARTVWAKADMMATVGFQRLDLFRTGRDQYGKRKYLQLKLPAEDLTRVRNAVLHALGLGGLTADTGQTTLLAIAHGPMDR